MKDYITQEQIGYMNQSDYQKIHEIYSYSDKNSTLVKTRNKLRQTMTDDEALINAYEQTR